MRSSIIYRSPRPLTLRASPRRPGLHHLRLAVGAGLHAVEDHARDGRDLVHLARGEDDGVAGLERALLLAVVEEAFAFEDVVDLVGRRMRMDRRDLAGLPADDADRAVRRL